MAIETRVHKKSGVTWYYIRFIKADGRRKLEKAGTTRKQAERLLKKRLGEVATGTYLDPRLAQERSPEGPIFNEFADRFQVEYGDQRRSDYYRQRLKPLRGHFGPRRMQDISRADLDQYGTVRSREVGASTLRKDLTVLGTMFRLAVRWGVLEASPAADLDKPSEPRHRVRYLSTEEWRRLEAAAPPWLKPMLILAVTTGLRLKELVELRWDHIDRENGLLHVSEDNKTGRPRSIPIGETVRSVLKAQVRAIRSPHVFVDSCGQPYTSPAARNRISKATVARMREAGLDDASFHTLRHTAASWLVQAGESLARIQKLLGHATITTTLRYAHLQPDHLRNTVRILDKAVRAAVSI